MAQNCKFATPSPASTHPYLSITLSEQAITDLATAPTGSHIGRILSDIALRTVTKTSRFPTDAHCLVIEYGRTGQ